MKVAGLGFAVGGAFLLPPVVVASAVVFTVGAIGTMLSNNP